MVFSHDIMKTRGDHETIGQYLLCTKSQEATYTQEPCTRVIVATHPATETCAKIGTTRGEVVYKLFYTTLPVDAFMPADVVALYLHRGAFETVLSDKARRVSAVYWPVPSSASISGESPPLLVPHPVLWGDGQRRFHRREIVKLDRHQRVEVQRAEPSLPTQPSQARPLSRAERAHYRLSWAQRLARNARARTALLIEITLFGVPSDFATFLGLAVA